MYNNELSHLINIINIIKDYIFLFYYKNDYIYRLLIALIFIL